MLDTTVYQTVRVHSMANGRVNHLGVGATVVLDQFWNA
jgi:hypothetical protein